MVKSEKTNGSIAPAAEPESVYAEGHAPDPEILAALDEAAETALDVATTEGRTVRRATIAEAAVHTLRRGGQVLYANDGPPYRAWRSIMRLDTKPVGSVEFVFGRVFHGELAARIYAQLELTFGRTGAGSHLHGPHLRPGETCEKVSVDAATVTETNGTATTWIKHQGLWFSAWRRAKQAPRQGFIDAPDPTPAPGKAYPRIAIS